MTLIEIDSVTKSFHTRSREIVHAVNGVSLAVAPGETLAVIGESGSGKSTLARVVLGLYPPDSGSVRFDGRDLKGLSTQQGRDMRAQLSVVFQEPDESLNPRMRIRSIVEEPLNIHERGLTRAQKRERVAEAAEDAALSLEILDRYPSQLSGGQQQRVGIARALVTRPRAIVLDEPTSSLDLSVRSQILRLLERLQHEHNLAFLFISHDIHTVRYISHRIAVMYLGKILEIGPTEEVFSRPRHPYTLALLSSALSPDPTLRGSQLKLSGEIPKPTNLPHGCYFYSRCPFRDNDRCATEEPPLREVAPDHWVASHYEVGERHW